MNLLFSGFSNFKWRNYSNIFDRNKKIPKINRGIKTNNHENPFTSISSTKLCKEYLFQDDQER